jgi:hypothetical protein
MDIFGINHLLKKRVNMEDKKIELSLSLVNGILQYMGTRPYQEVFNLVQAIQEQAIPQVPMPETKPEEMQ